MLRYQYLIAHLLFWPTTLLCLACSSVFSPLLVTRQLLFLTNDLSSTGSADDPPPAPVLMRHPSSVETTPMLQPITSSKSWTAISAAEVPSMTPWSSGRTSAWSCIRTSCCLLMASIISQPWPQGGSMTRLLLRSIRSGLNCSVIEPCTRSSSWGSIGVCVTVR